MNFKENFNVNRARIGTVVFHALLLLLIILIKPNNQEGGGHGDFQDEMTLTMNFGQDYEGSGSTAQAPAETPPPQTPDAPAEPKENSSDMEAVTHNDPNSPVNASDTEKEPNADPEEDANETTETNNQEVDQEPELTEEEIERQRKEAELNRRFNTQNKGQGKGDASIDGNQGDPAGDPLQPNRGGGIGSGANGSGDDYKLRGRTAVNKPIPRSDCNATGVVVVSVNVDANGKVTKATGGVNIPNGPKSNYVDPCLKRVAESAAKKTTWSAKNGANIETGYIVYRFELQ